MSDYGIISNSCMDDITEWVGNWHNGISTYEVSGQYLVDSEGNAYPENATENITSSDYANMSFGGVDPLDGSLPLFGLNNGGLVALDRTINLGNELAGSVLDSMTTTTGAGGMVYMSIVGSTPPIIDVSGPDYGPDGLVLDKYSGFRGYVDNAFQGFALEHLTMNVLFNDVVPRYLEEMVLNVGVHYQLMNGYLDGMTLLLLILFQDLSIIIQQVGFLWMQILVFM